jgi:hypothetical protein
VVDERAIGVFMSTLLVQAMKFLANRPPRDTIAAAQVAAPGALTMIPADQMPMSNAQLS